MESIDVAVIGRGLIGAAAARHLAERGQRTALVGPPEPAERARSTGPFSSHGDEGRITRIAGRSMTWTRLATRSIARYADIEERSGIRFHDPRGAAVSMADLDPWLDSGLVFGSNVHRVDRDGLRSATGIHLTNGHPVAYEGAPAGLINPRRLVTAQTDLAEAAGALVVPHVAALERRESGFEVSGPWGSVRAASVLVATGAFGRDLLEPVLDLERRPRTVLMAEVGNVGPLPSLIVADPPDERLEECYWVPPVRYPDGRIYLKIGGNLRSHPLFGTDDELVSWFQGAGDPNEIEALEQSLRSLLPDAEIGETDTAPCVITGTASGYPYIGWVDDGVAVAIGGNGSSAKSSDELGRLASLLFDGDSWDSAYDAALFKPQYSA
ncbi:MAG: FAD-dependent oxidoreductase [Actinomycetota bacterium]